MAPKKYDVIIVQKFQRIEVSGQNVIMIEAPIAIETNMTSALGAAMDVKKVLTDKNSVNLTKRHELPQVVKEVASKPEESWVEQHVEKTEVPAKPAEKGLPDEDYMPIKSRLRPSDTVDKQ